jgi:hypothetical protein
MFTSMLMQIRIADAVSPVNEKWKGRSHLSEAKERTTGMLMQGFIFLMGEAR